MAFEITTDLIFLAIIVVYGLLGAKKGCIKSVGGLIAMALSWLVSRTASLPLTVMAFETFDIESRIQSILSVLGQGVAEHIGFSSLPDLGNRTIFAISDRFTTSIENIVNKSALNFGTMLMTIVIFSLCMLIMMFIVRSLESVFENIPLGGMMNTAFGFVCGMVKGLILYCMGQNEMGRRQ